MNKSKILAFINLIKLEHTIFALPFAYTGYWIGGRGLIRWDDIIWVSIAMVSARTLGMCLNRIADLKFDKNNPRTSNRPLVTGELSVAFVRNAIIVCFIIFVIATLQLDPLCLKLLPLAMIPLFAYHYLKRFTLFCHFGIGLVLAFAPLGAWIAASGSLDKAALFLACAVLFWIAGFDIIYAIQDREFDIKTNLKSIPAKYGVNGAILVAGVCHLIMFVALIFVARLSSMGFWFYLGIGVTAFLLMGQHVLMIKDKSREVGKLFVQINGYLSIAVFVATVADLGWHF
ncbi:MAG: 4-hydroxybenzoate polyprenyltransferase [Candidatus Omnitrophota bacterium]|jgi:4-hydroxybenzoate polyprenyltransferase